MNCFRRTALQLSLPIALLALAPPPGNVAAQDRVIVQPRRVVVIRRGKEVRDFPERQKVIVRYPIVRGLSNSAVLRRIQNTLTMKNVFDHTLEEFRRETGLLSFDYEVNYNKNYLLDITFTEEAVGAYLEMGRKHFLINLKSGTIVRAADAFNPDSLNALVGLVDKKLKAEVAEQIKVNEDDTSSDAESKSWVRGELKKLQFGAQNLDEFSVSDKGVTFLCEATFPHAIQALEPDGKYFFSYAELRPHIKRNGPLGVFN
ncbi:MAG: hypothetical protein ACXW18_04555 [Pyrinomonadaceae bacterium]